MKNESVLHELYYGNLNPWEKCYTKDSGYAKCEHLVADSESALHDFLEALPEGGEPLQQLETLVKAQTDLLCFCEYEHFLEGFRLGANLVLETFVTPQKSVLLDIV